MAKKSSIGLLLGLLLISSAANASGPLPSQPHIYVKGSASIDFAPDSLSLTVRYSHTDKDLDVAKRSVDSRSRMFLKICSELGINKKDIKASELQISPDTVFRDGERHFLGMRVGRRVTINLENLDSYSNLITGLLESKPESIGSTTLSSTLKDKKLDEAQVDALKDATARATRLANAAGNKLGKIHSISEFDLRQEESWSLSPARYISTGGGIQVSGLVSASIVSSPSATEGEVFEPGMITAQAEVFVVFLLK